MYCPEPEEEEFEPPWRAWSAEDNLFYRYFSPTDGRVYHYTRQGSFRGIVDTFTFWCTDVRFFNDRTEVDHAYALLKKLLGKKEAEYGPDRLQTDVVRAISNGLKAPDPSSRYVVCFSKKPDDLNQYRAYASPGAGYCIGFELDDLWDLARAHGGTVGACLYGAREQEHVVEELLDDSVRELDQYFPVRGRGDINEDLVGARASAFLRSFARFAPLFKSGAFKEEEEIRIVFGDPNAATDIQFRCGEVAMVPYRAVSLSLADSRKLVPAVIYIKGTSEPELTKMGAEQFLLARGIAPSILEDSRLPYRETI